MCSNHDKKIIYLLINYYVFQSIGCESVKYSLKLLAFFKL